MEKKNKAYTGQNNKDMTRKKLGYKWEKQTYATKISIKLALTGLPDQIQQI